MLSMEHGPGAIQTKDNIRATEATNAKIKLPEIYGINLYQLIYGMNIVLIHMAAPSACATKI